MIRLCFRWLLTGLCIGGLFGTVVSGQDAAVNLPAESELPQQMPSLDLPIHTKAILLPSESKLPTSDPKPGPDALPPESALQDGGSQPKPVKPGRDRLDADAPGDKRPILRLNYSGHTGRIRTLTLTQDKTRLVSAGEDKDVHVWQRDPRDRSRWVHQRTIRWQVWRGPRGWIYDLDAHGNQVAMAGYGAMGGTGEIWMVDVVTGKLIRPLVDYAQLHRQAVQSIAWSEHASSKDDAARLVSADLFGRIVHWQADPTTGKWQGSTLVPEDTQTLGEQKAGQLQAFRQFNPVTFYGDQVAFLKLQRMQEATVPFPVWRLSLLNPSANQQAVTLPTEIPGLVTQMDSSEDGRLLVAACYSAREVKLWRRGDRTSVPEVQTFAVGGRPLFVDLTPDGKRMMVGTEAGTATSPSGEAVELRPQIQIFDLTQPVGTRPEVLDLDQTASAGDFDIGSNQVILAVGNALRVHTIGDTGRVSEQPVQTLVAPVRRITRVAASKTDMPTAVAISREQLADGSKPFGEVFNLSGLSLDTLPNPAHNDSDFLPPQRLDAKWTIRGSVDIANRFDLYRGENRYGRLPLVPEKHGRPTTISTAKSSAGRPLVIVGTEGQNNLYVFPADLEREAEKQAEQPPRVLNILRQFRGHSGAVRSTSATGDGRYLLSGGDDSLLCVWNLAEVDVSEDSINRWGATWEADDGRLLIDEIDQAGPLYFRGARRGDHLARIRWPSPDGTDNVADDSQQILKTLAEVPFDTQVVFEFARQGRPLGLFQMFPAWYPLATLVIDDQREWAMWTPSGIYNASIAGNKRFGWQLNRGLAQDIDFFRADQFKAALERPEVMRKLLSRGSLAAAMQDAVAGTSPPPGESAIVSQIASRPRIDILTPKNDAIVSGKILEVAARVTVPPGMSLASVKAFIDGIPGQQTANERIVTPDEGDATDVRWQFTLPSQTNMQLNVYAATSAQAAAQASVQIQREPSSFAPLGEPVDQLPTRQPQMHLLAIGIGNYADPNIQSLDFPAEATSAIAKTLRSSASGLYQVTSTQLVNREATRPLWRIYAETAVEQLRQRVSPDDLVVMYLCGHGVRDRRTGQWYFVTADTDYRDLMDDQYGDCLSLADLSLFSELPCRKIAILDSCHSGAVQSFMREDDLKAAIRFLQDDVVITLTASEGSEEAAEVVEAGLGRFTSRLVEALGGQADADRNGQVTLGETVRYVSRTVTADSTSEGAPQHPTAGPRELIERLKLPLTYANPKRVAVSP